MRVNDSERPRKRAKTEAAEQKATLDLTEAEWLAYTSSLTAGTKSFGISFAARSRVLLEPNAAVIQSRGLVLQELDCSCCFGCTCKNRSVTLAAAEHAKAPYVSSDQLLAQRSTVAYLVLSRWRASSGVHFNRTETTLPGLRPSRQRLHRRLGARAYLGA